MFFKKSIDNDLAFQQLLLEELVLEQIRFHGTVSPEGTGDWMGFPWCLQLCSLRLAGDGRKGSEAVIGSIIHAATQLARDTVGRRQLELASAKGGRRGLSESEFEQLIALLECEQFLPLGDPEKARALPPRDRAKFIRCTDELAHRLRVLKAKAESDPGSVKTLEKRMELCLGVTGYETRKSNALRAWKNIELDSERPEKYCLDGSGQDNR